MEWLREMRQINLCATHCKLRNHVTKLNKKKKLNYETNINEIKNDSKKLWSTLNEILGKKANSSPFITKPTDISNYFNDFFHLQD